MTTVLARILVSRDGIDRPPLRLSRLSSSPVAGSSFLEQHRTLAPPLRTSSGGGIQVVTAHSSHTHSKAPLEPVEQEADAVAGLPDKQRL